MWLNDLLPPKAEIRPTRPTSKNTVGRPQSLMAVAPSDTSDTKKTKNILSGEIHQKEEGIAQVSSKNPESVRHLPGSVAPEQHAGILEALDVGRTYRDKGLDAEPPTAAQLGHARRMLVDCPSSGAKLHCWHCSRCGNARRCTAWRTRRADVAFFRKSGEPYSLFLVESGAMRDAGGHDRHGDRNAIPASRTGLDGLGAECHGAGQ